ncbi:MAG: VCBS repeat-containing protein, partial [candidate division WOR-3 bacterium]
MSRILMQKASYLILLLLLLNHSSALIPLANTPSWTSIDNDYATGAGLADINNDCFIDFCTANGNDMAINKQAIYFNHNGSLETNASWRSADSGYFGHLYLGDINNDGWLDLAVSYLGFGISNQGRIRIYRNDSSGMATTPFWQSANQFNSFDVCFGDIDLD